MALQPYIILQAGDPNTLAASVVSSMAQGYIPLGELKVVTLAGSQAIETQAGSSMKTITSAINQATTFYQAMILKIVYEYDWLYKIYNSLY